MTYVLDKLIQFLYSERGEVMPIIPDDKKPLYFRALCNIRPPMPVPSEFLALQDEYLTDLKIRRGVVKATELDYIDGIALWRGDITRLDSDAIVNACNSRLLGCFQPLHYCIDNAIHSFGGVQIRLDCNDIMQGRDEPVGTVKVTKAYNLPSKFVFHTVGPQVSKNVTPRDNAALKSCYISCLNKAVEMKLDSIALCCISTGVYGYPKRQAAEVAVDVVKNYKRNLKVIFCVYGDENYKIYSDILK